MKILNFGSINIDYVYRVPHFVKPGETLASEDLQTFLGGKGCNQSVALAKAGATVFHAGNIHKKDTWIIDQLQNWKVDTKWIRKLPDPSGHAIIQVDHNGEN
ncbi:MAG: PfkB family carbohydrate kinase, partial [Bacteroidota bacterium]